MKKPFLTRLRELPEERRRIIALGAASTLTAIIFFVWIVSFSATASTNAGSKRAGLFSGVASVVAPFKDIGAQIVGAFRQSRDVDQALMEATSASTSPQQ
jgi:hypothetical protein